MLLVFAPPVLSLGTARIRSSLEDSIRQFRALRGTPLGGKPVSVPPKPLPPLDLLKSHLTILIRPVAEKMLIAPGNPS